MSELFDNIPQRDVFSVSRLNREARALLEAGFPRLWVEGEISNLARPASGHLYFTLKDARAQVSCALFRNRAMRLTFSPENGAQVLVQAQVSQYVGDGQRMLKKRLAGGPKLSFVRLLGHLTCPVNELDLGQRTPGRNG